eukprot:c24898_g1_i4 orf=58-840(+)
MTPFKETYHRKKGDPNLLSYIMRLEQSIMELQQKTEELQQQNQQLKTKVTKLEQAVDKKTQHQRKQELVKEVIQECMAHPEEVAELLEKTGYQHRMEQPDIKITDLEIQKQINMTVAEERDRRNQEDKLRFGGMDSQTLDELLQNESLEDSPKLQVADYLKEYGVYTWGLHTVKRVGQQVLLTFKSKAQRNATLARAHNLKHTKLWLAEDLTKAQLQQKKTELEKVRRARKEGLWAKYIDGAAVIRPFTKAKKMEPPLDL